jgi:hypothetical protein
MLTNLEIVANGGASLSLALGDPSSGYLVQDISGLGPVKATLVSSNYTQRDGAQYQSSRRETRNIVLKLGLVPHVSTDTVGALRNRLYSFFMPKSQVNIGFVSDDQSTKYILARIESFETVLFSKEPSVAISMICFDPDFNTGDPIQVLRYTDSTNEKFEIDYVGSVETGFYIYMDLPRPLNDLWIMHDGIDGNVEALAFNLPVDNPLSVGDRLSISTIAGAKGATVTRNNVTSSALHAIAPYATWINLHPGVNTFRVHTDGEPIPFWFAYFDKYGGL